MYNYTIDKAKKEVVVTVKGYIDDEALKGYLAEYKKTTQSINPSEYKFILDVLEQKALKQDLLSGMQAAVDNYLATGFKKVCITKTTSPTAWMQIKRLRGFDKIIWVDSVAEAHAA